MTRKLLEKKVSLIKESDQNGWTPLHHAAYSGGHYVMKILLEYDISAAYMKDKYRKMTPLHLAVSQGCIPDEIISHCPDCCELVDERGWNVVHFAMLSLDPSTVEIILENPLFRNLTNEKDVNGNTPLHLLAAIRPNLFWKIYRWKVAFKPGDVEVLVVNKHNMSVSKVANSGGEPLKQEILTLEEAFGPYRDGVVMVAEDIYPIKKLKYIDPYERLVQAREPHLIVATLIATVTFTAAFTLPGGVIQEGSDKGTAILRKSSAFQAFVITDAIAMVFSLCAVFAHFLMSIGPTRESSFLSPYALFSTLIAIGAMVIAFVTGTYAVLTTALWLAIVACFIGLTFFIFVFIFFTRLCKGPE